MIIMMMKKMILQMYRKPFEKLYEIKLPNVEIEAPAILMNLVQHWIRNCLKMRYSLVS